MSALDSARKVIARFDEYKRTLNGRIRADDLGDALRDLVDEVDAEHRDASLRELHHFETEAAITAALDVVRSGSVPLGVPVARHYDRLLAETRRILTAALESKAEPPADESDPFTVRGLMRALATFPPDAELGTSDPFIDVGAYAGPDRDWHDLVVWGEGVKTYTPKEDTDAR